MEKSGKCVKGRESKMVVPVAKWYSYFLANDGLLSNEKFGLSSNLNLKIMEKEIFRMTVNLWGTILTLRMTVVMTLIQIMMMRLKILRK